MSEIKILFRMSDQSFVFTESDLAPTYGDLMAGIVLEQGRLNMDNVSFGYSLKQGDTDVSSNSWPPEGVHYIETDQEVIEVERVAWEPDTEYTLDVWLNYSGIPFEGQRAFTTPPAPVEEMP
jgi:hypothetical protein